MPQIATFPTAIVTGPSLFIPLANFTTTSGTFVDVTGWTYTLPNRKGGRALVVITIVYNNSGVNGLTNFQALDAGNVNGPIIQAQDFAAAAPSSATLAFSTTLSGQIIKLQTASVGGVNTVTIYGTNGTIYGGITTLEVS